MSSHNLQNTTITQHMSVLGGGAGCWFTPTSPHQLPPTAPLRQKRQTSSHQALSVQHVMHQQQQHQQQQQQQVPPSSFAPISPPNTFTPISPPGGFAPISPPTQLPLSPKTPPGHGNHYNPHLGMPNSGSLSLHSAHAMSSSAQGLLLAHQPTATSGNNSMATSLHSMPALLQQQNHSMSGMLQPHHMQHQMPDISSIQQGLPQPLRGSGAAELRPCNMPWHHGKISRERAETLLQPRTDGLFLVRESTNFPGDQTLCVCFQSRVEHYRIKCGAHSTLTIDDEEFFDTLPQLIDHYLQDADGLCTQLVNCLPKQQVASAGPGVGAQQMAAPSGAPQPTPQQAPPQHKAGTAVPPAQAQLHQLPQPSAATEHMAPCLAPQAFVDAGWMIAERDLEIRENIGKGEFGDVMLGILNGQRVAVKILKDSEAASKFLAEASLMTSLKHENLVKLLGLVFNKQHICLVTEYMSKGSLVDYLRSRGRLHVTKRDQIMFAFDTCSGMEYLETRRVVHRDLAARNVLVSDTRRAKVADFGLAREEGGPDAAAKLPIKWTAPEALKHNKFSNKSDMWSFGILLWEIYSFGRVPYPRIPLADVVKHVEKGYKMEAPEGCPPELYDLMRQAWDLQPDTRPSFSQVKAKLAIFKANTPAQ